MARSDFEMFFYETFEKCTPFCALCFRTEEKLVQPKFVTKFSFLMKIRDKIQLTNRSLICIWCETIAKRACIVYDMISRATQIHKIVNTTIRFGSKSYGSNNQPPYWDQATNHFRAIRKVIPKPALTEILTVDTTGVHVGAGNGQHSLTQSNPPEDCTIILDDDDADTEADPLASAGPLNINPNMTLNKGHHAPDVFKLAPGQTPKIMSLASLLAHREKLAKDECIAALLQDGKNVLAKHGQDESAFVLHPIVIDSNGIQFVPTLNLVISQVSPEQVHNITKSMNLVPFEQNTNQNSSKLEGMLLGRSQTPENLPNTSKRKGLADISIDNRKPIKDNVAFGITTHGSNIVIIADNVQDYHTTRNIVSKTRKRSGELNIKTNSNKNHKQTIEICDDDDDMPLSAHINVLTNDVSTNTTTGSLYPTNQGKGTVIIPDEDDTPMKAPQLKKDGKIDWEDKIPMDVISFVNSNVHLQIETPQLPVQDEPETILGVISEVRSET